jgi:hypothetical protein
MDTIKQADSCDPHKSKCTRPFHCFMGIPNLVKDCRICCDRCADNALLAASASEAISLKLAAARPQNHQA